MEHTIHQMRVLVTGMSGTGKSTLVAELRRRGCLAYDADDDGFSEPRANGAWGWRIEPVRQLLTRHRDGPVFFAGCSEEQSQLDFDLRVLLTAPDDVMVERLTTRTTNGFGRTPEELAQVLRDLAEVEPLLRRTADLIIDTTRPVAEVADMVLSMITKHQADPDSR